jgi:hypothetical protein
VLALGHWQIREDGELGAAEALPESSIRWQDSSGPLVISRRTTSQGRCFGLHHGADLLVEVRPDNRLVIKARSDLPAVTVDHFIRDQVAPRVLAHEGHFVLHAAGVRNRNGLFLLMGKTGRGKSTLATSFDLNGWALLGDDAMVIDLQGEPRARAVYPSLRLMPDSIAALFPGPVNSTPIAHYSAKQRIALPDVAETAPLPVDAVFVLADGDHGDTVVVERMKPGLACAQLLGNSFALDPADLALAGERMRCAARLADQVPVYEVHYPRDYARLPAVRAMIAGTLRDQG